MYQINNTTISKPTTGKWEDRKTYGETGEGNSVYGTHRRFTLQWNFLGPSDVNILASFIAYSQNTGSVSVRLPQYAGSTYVFTEYSGCYLSDLQVGEYFEEYYENVTLVVNKVKVV